MKRLLLALSIIVVIAASACNSTPATPVVAPPSPATDSAPAAPAATTEAQPAPADEVRRPLLTVAIGQEPPTLDVYNASNDVVFIASDTIFESLLRNVDGKFEPWLAESYEIVDDTTIRFVLRDDVYFHNGSKMTAEDVLFSMLRAQASNFTETLFGAIDPEASAVIDEKTVEFKLSYPFAPIMEAFANYRGAIINKAAFEAGGTEGFGRNPVGTGPMKMKQWVAGDRIELELFDQYWSKKPAFDNLTYRVILEPSSRTIELETGGVDVSFDLPTTDWDRVESNPNLVLLKGNSLSMVYLCFNNENPLYGNELVRKAIAYAIDARAVAQTAYQGRAEVADAFMAKSIPTYKSGGPWPYDPDKSRELLKEAGYENGLEVKFVTFQQQYYNASIEIIQSMLAEVGITATIEMVDVATFTQMNNAGELPMTVMANSATILDPASALIAWPLSRTISLRHNDQHIQDLLDAGIRTYDIADRTPIYEELQDYLWEKLYLMPLAFPMRAWGASNTLENFPFVSTGIPDFAAIEFSQP